MITLRDLLPPNASPEDADDRLQQAYQNVFAGNGSQHDADLVLEDLLRFSGYYTTTLSLDGEGKQVPDAVLWQNEGMRRIVGRLLWMLDVPLPELRRISRTLATTPQVTR